MKPALRAFAFAVGAAVVALHAEPPHRLAPLPIAGANELPSPANGEHFTFTVAGDNRAAARGLPMPPTAPEIFSELRLLRPAFCLWTGDSIYGSDETVDEARREYADFLHTAASAETPVFNAPGNHEIFDRRELEQVYTDRMGLLYGSFDYGRSHFIALDTEAVGASKGIGPAQLAWLTADLEAHASSAHTFVFSHHPLFPKDPADGFSNPANRNAIHRLFVSHHVDYVFSGHEHLYYASVHDGVHYVVTGGGGAPTDGPPDDGGFQHYVLVTVAGARITTTLLEPWRLFAQPLPAAAGRGAAVIVSNYERRPVSVTVPFEHQPATAAVSATWTYKGKTHPLAATLSPTETGIVVRLTVPAHRAAVVSVQPAASAESH